MTGMGSGWTVIERIDGVPPTPAVSADGSAIVGASQSGNGREAFRWTPETGMVGLGDLPGGGFGSAALAADGRTILYSSHVLDVVEKICNRVLIIHKGNLIADESPAHLQDRLRLPAASVAGSEVQAQLALTPQFGQLTH